MGQTLAPDHQAILGWKARKQMKDLHAKTMPQDEQ
jgi:hypothetical protein